MVKMGTIRGWRKSQETSIWVFWVNENGKTWVEVRFLEPTPAIPRADWTFVTNVEGNFYFNNLKCKKFKSKAAAVRVAEKWMRGHPKG